MPVRRTAGAIAFAAVAAWRTAAPAGPDSIGPPPDWMEAGRDWIEENIDPAIVSQAVERVDVAKLEAWCRDIQSRLQSTPVVDLAALEKGARGLLGLLRRQEETRPYASWLEARLDYFAAAAELRPLVQARPTPRPPPPLKPTPQPSPSPRPDVQPPKAASLAVPSAALERQVWRRMVSRTSAPPVARDYVNRLKPLFRSEGVPEELVWLAEVESSFDPKARSPAGAVGLFQLMSPTAKACGLRTFPLDERKHPEKSARATARYLKRLYMRFRSWPLTLAAYNAGETRVGGLLDRQPGRTFDDISDALPSETQLYVPKVDAVLLRREGKPLDSLPPAA